MKEFLCKFLKNNLLSIVTLSMLATITSATVFYNTSLKNLSNDQLSDVIEQYPAHTVRNSQVNRDAISEINHILEIYGILEIYRHGFDLALTIQCDISGTPFDIEIYRKGKEAYLLSTNLVNAQKGYVPQKGYVIGSRFHFYSPSNSDTVASFIIPFSGTRFLQKDWYQAEAKKLVNRLSLEDSTQAMASTLVLQKFNSSMQKSLPCRNVTREEVLQAQADQPAYPEPVNFSIYSESSLKDPHDLFFFKKLIDKHKQTVGGNLGFVAIDFRDNEVKVYNETLKVNHASSAKWMFLAAALQKQSIKQVDRYAPTVFRTSDNYYAGILIDLAGGINAVNSFSKSIGIPADTWSTCNWNYRKRRLAKNCSRILGGRNLFSPKGIKIFLKSVYERTLFDDPQKNQYLFDIGKMAPDYGTGGWLTAELPDKVQSKVKHKAGWIPRNAGGKNTLNSIGFVPVPGGIYGVGIVMEGGSNYGEAQKYMQELSKKIYRYFDQKFLPIIPESVAEDI